MEKQNTCVALVSNISGGCQYVAKVKTITKSEYATLLAEQRQHEIESAREKRELLETINELKEQVSKLAKEIKVLKGEDEDEESVED